VEPFATALGLTAAGALLVVATILSPLSQRLGVPVLLVILAVGMLAGSEGVGRIPFEDYRLAFRVGTVALTLILFDGGLGTPYAAFRGALARAAMLASVGVVLTAAVVALAAIALGFPPALAVLLGAVVSSTDAAAVFSVLRSSGVRLKERTGATLEVESGLNDPIAMLLTVVATEIVLGERHLDADVLVLAAQQLGLGVAFGLAFGYAGRALFRVIELPAAGLYPVLTAAMALAAYGLPTLLDGSGFLSVYLTGLVLAGGPLPYRAGVRRVHDALAWLSQLAMFLILGLLVFPSRLLATVPVGLALALALTVVARPLAVAISLLPFRLPSRELGFVGWVGLRGAVPIVLATYPVLRGVPHGELIFHVVFFVVLVNAIVPGMTVGWLARRTGLAAPASPSSPATVELVSLREYPGEFVWYTVDRASAVAGATVRDLPLPDGCVLTLVLRGDEVVAPHGDTIFAVPDHVCLFVRHDERAFVDLLFGRGEEDAV
jgi:cell volume regulation protein A